MTELRVGVIGCGGHARSHLAMIAAEPRMRLIAAADLDESRLAEVRAHYQLQKTYTDYRQMLDDTGLDVVYVVTLPVHLRAIVIDCLQRNVHTSIEKPPGMSMADTEAMVTAARESEGLAILSFNRRYYPEILAIRHLLRERGGATQVSAVYHKPPSNENRSERPPEITSDAIHHVDLLRWLASREPITASKAKTVYAQSWQGRQPGSPRYNALIEFDNGCRGTMMSHYGVGYRIQQAEVHADGLSAYLDLTRKPTVVLYEDGQLRTDPLPEVVPPSFNETTHFADCILNGLPLWSPLEDALDTMRLCTAIEQGHMGPLPA